MLGQGAVPAFSEGGIDSRARRRQLGLILLLRLLALIGQLAIVGWVHLVLQIPLPWPMMLACSAVLAVVTAASVLWLRKAQRVSDGMLMAQLLVDVAALSLFLYASGGASNPFGVLYVVPVALAAALLPAAHVAWMVGITVSCYLVLARFNIPLPHLHHYHLGEFFYLHVQGMLVAYSSSALLVAGVVWWMASSVRQRDVALGVLQEHQKLDDAMARVGWQAAHLAHELSTPLSTLAVLVHELQDEYRKPAPLAEGLNTLSSEITRCAQAIDRVMKSVGDPRAGKLMQVDVGVYMRAQWREAAMEKLTCEWGDIAPCQMMVEDTVGEILRNLWHNAEAAGATRVSIQAVVQGQRLHVKMRDNGHGIPEEAAGRLGHAPVPSAKGDGHGRGLWLGRMALRRWGGDLILRSGEGKKGTEVEMILPLPEVAHG